MSISPVHQQYSCPLCSQKIDYVEQGAFDKTFAFDDLLLFRRKSKESERRDSEQEEEEQDQEEHGEIQESQAEQEAPLDQDSSSQQAQLPDGDPNESLLQT